MRRITREATMQMRRQLGLAERARLPDSIKHLIDAAARDVVESALEAAVAREVTGTAERMARFAAKTAPAPVTPAAAAWLAARYLPAR